MQIIFFLLFSCCSRDKLLQCSVGPPDEGASHRSHQQPEQLDLKMPLKIPLVQPSEGTVSTCGRGPRVHPRPRSTSEEGSAPSAARLPSPIPLRL